MPNNPNKRPRIIFAGTPDFSVPSLNTLIDADVDVVAVYTQPDRPAGRGKQLRASPVKLRALEAGLNIEQPHSLKKADAKRSLRSYAADLMVVTAYGLILPQSVLEMPRLGCVNVHASLLPRWRGAAPIQRAIEAEDTETGITLMQMDVGLDTGDMLVVKRTPISPEDTGGSLHDRLAVMGGDCLAENLSAILAQSLQAEAQDSKLATYAHKLEKAETRLDWHKPATNLANTVRAFNPWPVATTQFGNMLLRIHAATASASSKSTQLGEVVEASNKGIGIQTGNGVLWLQQLQKPGGKSLSAAQFLNGFSIQVGDQFG